MLNLKELRLLNFLVEYLLRLSPISLVLDNRFFKKVTSLDFI